MNYIGQIVGIGFICVIFFLFGFVGDYINTEGGYGLYFLFVVLSWWLGKQFDKICLDNATLKKRSNELEKKNRSLQESKDELQQFHESLDMTFFSFDIVNNCFYVLKGFEQIFGHLSKDFHSNPSLWKTLIHPEDVWIVDKNEQRLNMGESIQMKHRIITSNNEIRWVLIKANPIQNLLGKVIKVNGTFLDVTVEKQLEEKLKQMAYYDHLTDLPNRAFLEKQLKKVLARSKRHSHCFLIAFMDLDGFKKVNDKLGHESGDILLQEVANRLNNTVREEDLIARIGGDEFVIVFEETEKEEVEGIFDRILIEISKAFVINNQEVTISPSIGISMFPRDGENSETLIKNADKAMYFAKTKGKNNYQFYNPDVDYS